MTGETILITGAAGYIGTLLANRLKREGYNIILYDSLIFGKAPIKRLDAMLAAPQMTIEDALLVDVKKNNPRHVRFIQGKTSSQDLAELFKSERFDYVFHLAEHVGEPICNANIYDTHVNNYIDSKEVVDLAFQNGALLVYNSTSSVYGSQNCTGVSEESSVPSVRAREVLATQFTPYSFNKLLIEQHIEARSRETQGRYVILRPATLGGLSLRMRLDLLPNHFTYAALTEKKLKLSNGQQYRAIVAVDDLIEGYMAILRKYEGHLPWKNGTFNFGHLNSTKLDFAQQIGGIAGVSDFVQPAKNLGDLRSLQITSERFTNEFGFRPDRSLVDIVNPLIRLVRRAPYIFESSKFKGVINCSLEEWNLILGRAGS